MFARIVDVNMNTSCWTMPTLRRREARVTSADVHPVDGYATLCHVVEAGDKVHYGGLTAAGRAQDGDHLCPGGLEVHTLEYRRKLAVPEGHVLKAHVTPHSRNIQGVTLLLHRRLRVQNVEDALAGGHCPGEAVYYPRRHADRYGQQPHEQHE